VPFLITLYYLPDKIGSSDQNVFYDDEHSQQVDIFIDRMQMCHNIDFRSRVYIDERTLSPACLLLTKMQIVEVNKKDLLDVVALFIDYDVEEDNRGINSQYISRLASNDWGYIRRLT
jgi:hypothetical protein